MVPRTLAVLLALTAPGLAGAQDFNLYAGGELSYSPDRKGPLDPTIPTPRGADTDDAGNALELSGYVEADYRGFYGGIGGFLARGVDLNRVDLYLGYHGETAQGFRYYASYRRYVYPDEGGNCCGQLAVDVDVPLGLRGTGRLALAIDPERSEGSAAIGLDYAVTDRISTGITYGAYDVRVLSTETQWDVGATWRANDQVGADLRWHDGSDYPGFVALKVKFDTTLLSR